MTERRARATAGSARRTARSPEGGPNLGELAYRQLRGDILRCVLLPGTGVTEGELAARYGLGKAPIRTALTRLAHEGLIESSPRRGWVVAPITLRDVHELFQLRLILEPQASRLAAGKIREEDLRELDGMVRLGYRPGDPESQTAFLDANRRFHVKIAEATGNRRLAELVTRHMEEIGRVLHLGLASDDYGDKFQHEHRELIAALVEGDEAAAESLTYTAIREGERIVMEAVLKTPAVLDFPVARPASARAPESRARR
jgi:DNA-binding GntR family transcriptional regulator